MDSGNILDLWTSALMTAVKVGAPFLLVALAIGLLTSLIQAATQLQENILSFVPKLIAVGLVLTMGGAWILDTLKTYTETAVTSTVDIGREGRQ